MAELSDLADGPVSELKIRAKGNGVLQWLVDGVVVHEVQYKQGEPMWIYYQVNDGSRLVVWSGPVP